jgi:2-keto-4-pentenoate hydratase/2-oxohepta-3-ene-1,7-dioic acid hydratase (catechol pathway)
VQGIFSFLINSGSEARAVILFVLLGPCIADKAEIKDPMSLDIEMRVNGNIMQKANTEEMIFDIPYILEFITETITLLPGDVVATGTPAGVGVFRKPHYFLKDGDVMEANIEGIGKLENAVIFEK